MDAFVGRTPELQALEGAASRARSSLAVVVVVGPAGVGKTSLVHEFLRSRREPVRHVPVTEFDGDLVADALRADPGSIVVVEDLHWASDEALAAVGTRMVDSSPDPSLLVLTARPSPTGPLLAGLLERAVRTDATVLRLPELGEVDVRLLAERTLRVEPTAEVMASLRRCGGNPLWVTEVLREIRAGVVSAGGVPPSVRAIAEHRVDALGPAGAMAMGAAAVLGRFTPDDLAAVARIDQPEVVALTLAATRAGLLDADGEEFVLRHELLRDAIYDATAEPVRGVLHLRAAQRADERGARPAVVAHHAERAAVTSPDAVTWFVDCAIRLSRVAWYRAGPVLSRAADLLDPEDPRRRDVEARRISSLAVSGRIDEARALAAQLLRDPRRDEARDDALAGLLLASFDGLSIAQQPTEMTDLVTSMLHDLQESPNVRCAAALNVAVVHVMSGRFVAARRAASVGLELCAGASRGGMVRATLVALAALHHAGAGQPHLGQAELELLPVGAQQPTVELVRACLLADLDDLVGAGAFARRAAELDLDREPGAAMIARSVLAFVDLLQGDLAAARRDLDAAWAISPLEPMDAPRSILDAVEHRLSQLVGAGEVRTSDPAQEPGILCSELASWIAALTAEQHGDVDAAAAALRVAWDALGDTKYFLTWRTVAPDLVRLAVAAGDVATAARVTEDARRGATASDVATARAAHVRCEALLRGDATMSMSAADAFWTGGRPLDAAACLVDGGRLLRGTDRGQSRTLLAQAAAIYDACGAHRAAEEARGRVGPGRPPARVLSGWDALTPSERSVALLVAEGLTNPQIASELSVSRHTVGTHLRRVFAKLGVSTRAAVASAVAKGVDSPAR